MLYKNVLQLTPTSFRERVNWRIDYYFIAHRQFFLEIDVEREAKK